MFQKLYRLLENINDSLQKNRLDTEGTNDRVEQVNNNLASINESIRSQKSTTIPLFWQIMHFCVSLAVVLFFAYYIFHQSNESAVKGNAASSTTPPAYMESRQKEINQEIATAGIHLQKLDSLIGAQAQSLNELKHLNRVAVRTFQHIRKRLDEAGNEPTGKSGDTSTVWANRP